MIKLNSALKANILNVKKITIVPKYQSNLTEGLSQNIVLQFVVTAFMEENFSADLVCIEAFLQIENYSEFHMYTCKNFIDLGLLMTVFVHDLRTVSFSFLVTSFDEIF